MPKTLKLTGKLLKLKLELTRKEKPPQTSEQQQAHALDLYDRVPMRAAKKTFYLFLILACLHLS